MIPIVIFTWRFFSFLINSQDPKRVPPADNCFLQYRFGDTGINSVQQE